MWTFLYRQYFFERNGVKIEPSPGDHVIDGGGCFGDTAIHFADAVGAAGHVYVFDPLPKHCAIMREQLAMNPPLAPRITIFPSGLADVGNDLRPLPADDVINPGARVVASAMPLTTIDDTVAQSGVPRVDFIKLDIEGSELGALRGAESTLRSLRPKLAVSLYHRVQDFFSIPLLDRFARTGIPAVPGSLHHSPGRNGAVRDGVGGSVAGAWRTRTSPITVPRREIRYSNREPAPIGARTGHLAPERGSGKIEGLRRGGLPSADVAFELITDNQ